VYDYIIFGIETIGTTDPDRRKRIKEDPKTYFADPRTPKVKADMWAKLSGDEQLDYRIQETSQTSAAHIVCVVSLGISSTAAPDTKIYRDQDYKDKTQNPDVAYTQMLRELANYWASTSHERTVWVGHDIMNFDLPMILSHWGQYELVPPPFLPIAGRAYTMSNVWDASRHALMVGKQYSTLVEVCEMYGVQPPPHRHAMLPKEEHVFDVSLITKWYRQDEHMKISEHCFNKVVAAFDVFRKATFGMELM